MVDSIPGYHARCQSNISDGIKQIKTRKRKSQTNIMSYGVPTYMNTYKCIVEYKYINYQHIMIISQDQYYNHVYS